MARNDVAWLSEHTFLRRVPALIVDEGYSLEAAIVEAKRRDDKLCLMFLAPEDETQHEAVAAIKHAMCERLYQRLRTSGATSEEGGSH